MCSIRKLPDLKNMIMQWCTKVVLYTHRDRPHELDCICMCEIEFDFDVPTVTNTWILDNHLVLVETICILIMLVDLQISQWCIMIFMWYLIIAHHSYAL